MAKTIDVDCSATAFTVTLLLETEGIDSESGQDIPSPVPVKVKLKVYQDHEDEQEFHVKVEMGLIQIVPEHSCGFKFRVDPHRKVSVKLPECDCVTPTVAPGHDRICAGCEGRVPK